MTPPPHYVEDGMVTKVAQTPKIRRIRVCFLCCKPVAAHAEGENYHKPLAYWDEDVILPPAWSQYIAPVRRGRHAHGKADGSTTAGSYTVNIRRTK